MESELLNVHNTLFRQIATQTNPFLDLLNKPSNHPILHLLKAKKLPTIVVSGAMAPADLSLCQAIEETDQLLKRQHLEKSRELDIERGTELGTLGFLPWEIRQQILKLVLDGWFFGHFERAPRTLFYGTGPTRDIFNNYFYDIILPDYISGYTSQALVNLRLSSATLGFECEGIFLFNTIFKFQCPTDLEDFLDQIPNLHQTKVRRIIISIWVPCGCRSRWAPCDCRSRCLCKDWRDGCKTACLQLPMSLRQVSFELGYKRSWGHAPSCRERGISRRSNQIKAVANFVEILGKTIVRSAPDAVIELHEHAKKWLLPEEIELFDAAVNDIER